MLIELPGHFTAERVARGMRAMGATLAGPLVPGGVVRARESASPDCPIPCAADGCAKAAAVRYDGTCYCAEHGLAWARSGGTL